MSQTFKIHLQGTGNTQAWVQAQGVLKSLDSQAQKFMDSLRAGVGIDLGGRLVSSLASLPNVFTDVLKRGFDFNVTMRDTEVAVSNVLQKFNGLSQAAGDLAASEAMQQMIELEPKAAGTMRDLAQGFLATAASASSAGMTVQQNIDLVGKFANGLANASIPAEQLSQEMRAAFSGNITPDAAFAKIIGLTNEMVRSASASGTLYEELAKRIGKLGEAGDTAAVAMSSLESAVDKASGLLAEPLFEAVIEAAKDFSASLGDPVIMASLTEFGVQIGELTRKGIDLTKWALANAPALLKVAESIAKVGGAVAAIKFATLLAGLARSVSMWGSSVFAIRANTVALEQNAVVARTAAVAQGTAGAASAVSGVTAAAGAAGAASAATFSSRFAGALPGLMNAAGVGLIIGAIVKVSLDAAIAVMDQGFEERLQQAQAAAKEKAPSTKTLDLIVRADTPELKAQAKRYVENWIKAVEGEMAKNGESLQGKTILMTLQAQLRDFDHLAGSLGKTNPGAAANEAAAKQSAFNKTLDELASAAGDAEAELRLLNAQYNELIAKAQKALGLKDANPFATAGDLRGLITPDTGNSEQGGKALELIKQAGELQDKIGKKTDELSQKREQDDARARQAENELLEFKVRALEAAGKKAAAIDAKVLLEARQLAEQLFNAGSFSSFNDAFEDALGVAKKEGEIKRGDDEKKVSAAREVAGIEDRIAQAKAAGHDKEAAALEDQRRVVELAQQLEDSLKISHDEALQRAKDRVANERTALGLTKERGGLEAALAAREKEIRHGAGDGKVTSDEAEQRRQDARDRAARRGGIAFGGLGALDALQNDPRRRRPVSSVSLPASVAKPAAAGGASDGAVSRLADASQRNADSLKGDLNSVTTQISRIYANIDRATGEQHAILQRLLNQLEATEKKMTDRYLDLQRSMKNNRV